MDVFYSWMGRCTLFIFFCIWELHSHLDLDCNLPFSFLFFSLDIFGACQGYWVHKIPFALAVGVNRVDIFWGSSLLVLTSTCK